MHDEKSIKAYKRIVIKIGTSTLTYENGRANLERFESLCRVVSDLMNQGKEVVIVSSGAISMGMGRLRLKEKPRSVREEQAIASVGQCELMNLYSRFFSQYSYVVGQILLTKDDIDEKITRSNITNTFNSLIEKEIIPIVNENDTVSTREILHNGSFGDNDTLSAIVAEVVGADLLILLSDIAGLYDSDPKKKKDAVLIDTVYEITPDIMRFAGDASSSQGTGGMLTKMEAAKIATNAGIDMVIVNGNEPSVISSVVNGEKAGTLFVAKNISS